MPNGGGNSTACRPDYSAAASAAPSAGCWETSSSVGPDAGLRRLGESWACSAGCSWAWPSALAGGIEEKSGRKCRNGAIGGTLGGLLGGVLIQILTPGSDHGRPGHRLRHPGHGHRRPGGTDATGPEGGLADGRRRLPAGKGTDPRPDGHHCWAAATTCRCPFSAIRGETSKPSTPASPARPTASSSWKTTTAGWAPGSTASRSRRPRP